MNRHLFFLTLSLLISWNEGFTQEGATVKVILDTDMGSDCDDVGALAMLNEYANRGQAEILGVIYSSGVIRYGVGVIDAINRYYGNEDIPIGANYDNKVGDPVDKMQAEKLAKDTSAFKNKIIENTDAVEQTQLIRRILSHQPDNSVVYITIGHTKGLYDLLASESDTISSLSGMELAKKKIKKWVALGALKAANKDRHYVKDWNFFFNGTAEYTKFLVEHFSKPVYFVDAGADIMTGKSLTDTPNGNIVRTAYRDWLWNVEKKLLNDQRPSWDLMTVYFAIEEPKKHFDMLGHGSLEFDPEKGCRWHTTDEASNQYFVRQKEGYKDEIEDYLNAMICKKNKGD